MSKNDNKKEKQLSQKLFEWFDQKTRFCGTLDDCPTGGEVVLRTKTRTQLNSIYNHF